ncbi:unnamed protein product [Adineta ricciae]|uniref:Uncharacterized protein n=1 Tax=Adineta ricciae TaxID=249248 RepID=A0A815M8X8_ADIRI|nr:unnamed protein product [Adineta ricciae]
MVQILILLLRACPESMADATMIKHALLLVGYSDVSQIFIGDGGYCYTPYKYSTDKGLINYARKAKKWKRPDGVKWMESIIQITMKMANPMFLMQIKQKLYQ